jgi:hypothetical protein
VKQIYISTIDEDASEILSVIWLLTFLKNVVLLFAFFSRGN